MPPGTLNAPRQLRPNWQRSGWQRSGWLVAAVPALAELIVGGYRIAGPSLWRDEAATISGSQRPVTAIVSLAGNQDAVHGLYYLIMHPVIAVGGGSATTLRLPSLIAMCLAVGLTAVLGARLARAAALPAPALTGVLAGLLLTAVPLTTRYAQEARPYALTTLFAVLATYLLVRAAGSGRWPWWAAYAVALALTGMFNLFAVLLASAHGISLLAARASAAKPDPPVARSGAEPAPVSAPASAPVAVGAIGRWLVACVVAAALLAPMAVFTARQSAQLDWVTRPGLSTVATLIRDFAGTTLLIPLVALLGGLGCVAGRGLRRGGGLTLAVTCLPWLVLPPAVLLAVSFAHPVYVERYVVFCLPALTLLTAAGLAWLAVLTGRAADRFQARQAGRGQAGGGQAGGGPAGRRRLLLAVTPSVLLAVVIAVVLAGPQAAVRLPSSRPDNLRAVAALIGARERPGDAVLYLPWNAELVGVAYPASFVRLRDLGLGESPIASATLRGLPASPGTVVTRLAAISRLWTVSWAEPLPGEGVPASERPVTQAIGALRLIGRWQIGSVLLSLYASR